MKTYKSTALLLTLVLFSFSSFSQNILAAKSDFNWRIMPGYPNLNLRLFGMYDISQAELSLTGDYSKSIIYLNDNEAVLLTQVNDKKGKVIRFNAQMKVLWETEFSGRGLAIGKLKDKVVLFRMDRLKLSNWKDNTAEAVVMDISNGNISNRKPIVGPYKKNGEEWKFYIPADGNSFFTGVRETSHPLRITFSGFDDKYDNTESFTLYQYDASLKPVKEFAIKGDFVNTRFLGSEMDANGDLLIISAKENMIIGELFSAKESYANSEKLSTAINVKSKSSIYPYLMPDAKKPGQFLMNLKYTNKSKDEESDLIKFDFIKGKAFTNSNIFDKTFRSNLNVSLNTSCGQDKTKLESLDFLKVTQIITTSKNKHIVLSEWIGPKRQPTGDLLTGSETATIDFYDEDLKHQKRIAIPKTYLVDFPIGLISSVYERDGKIYFVAAHDKGRKTYTMLSVIDMNNMNVLSCNILDKKELDKNSMTDPPAVLWFKDGFIIPHINYKMKAFVNAEYDYQMQKIAY